MTNFITQSEFTELTKEIRNGFQLIGDRLERLEVGQTEIKASLTDLDKRVAVVESKVDSTEKRLSTFENKLPELSEKVGELKNWKQIGVVVITALISSVFTGTIGGVIGWFLRGSRI